MLTNGVDCVDCLNYPRSVTVSPDGNHVYIAAYDGDALAVFSRNAGTGELTFIEAVEDGGLVDGLGGAYSVTVSPDGAHVYAAGHSDNAVVVFRRDTNTGTLTFVEVIKDGEKGADKLAGAVSVTVSPDNEDVYVGAYIDNALTVFSRDTETGELTFSQVLEDGVGDVDGLNGVLSTALSPPDGAQVYAVARTDNSLAVFSRVSGALTVTITDCKTGASGELVIPESIDGNPVTEIADEAFRDCTGLTNVTIPAGVTSIAENNISASSVRSVAL